MYLLVTKNKRFEWYWKLVADNETFFSKWNAKRSAYKLAKANGYEVRGL